MADPTYFNSLLFLLCMRCMVLLLVIDDDGVGGDW